VLGLVIIPAIALTNATLQAANQMAQNSP
jgi:hypothetical protein